MSFSQKLQNRPVKLSPVDKLNQWVDALPDSEREAALEILRNDSEWSQSQVVEVFNAEGYAVHKGVISDWRRAREHQEEA